MLKEDRIKLRDVIFDQFKEKKIIIPTKLKNGELSLRISCRSNIIKLWNNDDNNNLHNLYDQYVNEFRTEEEALWCILHQDDFENHICPICHEDICEFKEKYRKLCKNRECYVSLHKSEEVESAKIRTCMKKYGKKYISQIDEFKERIAQINISKYGNKSFVASDKFKQVMLERHGVDHPYHSEQIKNKAIQTCIQNNGVAHPGQNEDIKNKIIHSHMMKNTLNNPICDEDISDVLNDINELYQKSIHVCEIYTSDEYLSKFIELLYNKKNRLLRINELVNVFKFIHQTIRNRLKKCDLLKYFHIHKSPLELQFEDFLNLYNIRYQLHDKSILSDHKELDFYLEDYNIAFEINDMCSHNIMKINDPEYHLRKSLQCEQQNISLIHIWEWELTNEELWNKIQNDILRMINSKKELCADQVIVNQSNCDENIRINLYYLNELIQSFMFKKRLGDEYELINAFNTGKYIISGINGIFKSVVQQNNIQSVIVCTDVCKFNDKLYKRILGIDLVEIKRMNPTIISYDKNEQCSSRKCYNCGYRIYKIV